MAEKGYRDGSTRRQSFRRTLADADLTDDDLEKLELKRKQLDESIHKFIAAKERDYKSFERELIQRHRLGHDKEGSKARRTSAEPAQELVDSPRLKAQQKNGVSALLSAGLRRDQIQFGQPVPIAVVDEDGPGTVFEARSSAAGLVDRRASIERDKEFVGVFTPAFLPALEHGGLSPTGRADSGPANVGSPRRHQSAETDLSGRRVNSDTCSVGLAKPKRPVELQFSGRTSSSGSSADGKLPSAMKSPTHAPRPRKKRVSLAVGDSIVSPSDNVPVSMSNNSTPSHSRTRAPATEREQPHSAPTDMDARVHELGADTAASHPPAPQVAATSEPKQNKEEQPLYAEAAGQPAAAPIIPGPSPKSDVDVDGDLDLGFNLDEDDDDDAAVTDSPLDSEDDVAGRVASPSNGEYAIYESGGGGLTPELEGSDDHAQHLEFRPSSIQRTTSPGFRRPSVSMDPVYTGPNYARAESHAVANEIYGSSFNRPSSKGSFTAGSLGESFMAQNAERMMRDRAAHEQAQVRS